MSVLDDPDLLSNIDSSRGSPHDHQRRLRAIRDDAVREAEAVLAGAERRGRLLASEQRTFDRLLEVVGRADAALDAVDSRLAAADRAARKYPAMPSSSLSASAVDADALRSFLGGDLRRIDFDLRDAVRHVDERTGRVTVGERRDLTVGSATAGGNTVPTSFVPRLMEHMIETASIRQTNVTVFTTDGGDDLEVPKTTAHSSASIVAEGAALTESDPVFGQVTLQAYKYGGMIQVSTELLQDTGVDLVGYLARQCGRAIGNASGAHFVTGTGTGQPRGIVTAATVGVTGGTGVAGAFTADNLIDLYHSVIPEYRARGTWMMSDAAAAAARKLKDSNGAYLWERDLTAGDPPRLLGRPVVIDTNVADPALSAKSVVFGDFSSYAIRDVRQIRFERSDDYAFANDLVTFRYLFRTDGDLVDETGAVKVFQGGAT